MLAPPGRAGASCERRAAGVDLLRRGGGAARGERAGAGAGRAACSRRWTSPSCWSPPTARCRWGAWGTLHATVTVRGRRAHSARPWQGENALYRAIPLLAAAPRSWSGARSRFGELTYYEVIVATQARTENSKNVVPDRADAQRQRALRPRDTPWTEAEAGAAGAGGRATAEVEVIDARAGGRGVPRPPAAGALARARRGSPVQCKQAWTDVARFTERGIPAVNFGPGETAQAHQAGEWCSIDVAGATSLLRRATATDADFAPMNPRVDEIPPSLIRAINARKRPGDIDLGLGEPTLRPDPAPLRGGAGVGARARLPLLPQRGLRRAARAIVAAYLGAPRRQPPRASASPSARRRRSTSRSRPSLDPARDEVLIVEPCYLAYPKICLLEGIAAPHGGAATPRTASGPRADGCWRRCGPRRGWWCSTPRQPHRARLAGGGAGGARRRAGRARGPPVHVLSDEVYRELYYTAGSARAPSRSGTRTRWWPARSPRATPSPGCGSGGSPGRREVVRARP